MDSLHDEGLAFAEKLKKAGVRTEVHEFPNAAHGFTLKPSEDTNKALELMADFINGCSVNSNKLEEPIETSISTRPLTLDSINVDGQCFLGRSAGIINTFRS
jgi:hypothetical protein